jgi:hypothetical protein
MSGATARAAGGGGGGDRVNVHTSSFLCQTLTMLSDEGHRAAVRWGRGGASIVIDKVSERFQQVLCVAAAAPSVSAPAPTRTPVCCASVSMYRT